MQAGLVGLGVMGRNLALHLRDKGHQVVATDSWKSAREWRAPGIRMADDHAMLAGALDTPRVVLLMVKAGDQIDKEIAALRPYLSPGDVIVDGGNSRYLDTELRCSELAAVGIGFLGVGISGGAEGARHGASMMVGGDAETWAKARGILASVAATSEDNQPTIQHFGTGGAGHFVKMIHNGIEYAIMQGIAECHDVLRDYGKLPADQIASHFARWGTDGPGAGFLLEITAEIANARDTETGGLLLPLVDDAAGQKGTGGWTAQAAIDYGVAAPSILEALAARQLSGDATVRSVMRATMAQRLGAGADADFIKDLETALAATMLVSLAQGLQVYAAAAQEHGWHSSLGDVLRVWRAGSILRMRMLDELAVKVDQHGGKAGLLAVPDIARSVVERLPAWRRVVALAIGSGCPVPVLAASLGYAEALGGLPLPTAVIQAQRDRFGAHGFKRTDRPGDHHGPWLQPDEEAGR